MADCDAFSYLIQASMFAFTARHWHVHLMGKATLVAIVQLAITKL